MNRFLYFVANFLGGIVLVILLVNPRRPLIPIFVLLGAAILCAVIPSLLQYTSGLARGGLRGEEADPDRATEV